MGGANVLVVDAGSSALRCHVYEIGTGIVASADSRWTLLREPDAPELAQSFDPQAVWVDAASAIARCIQNRAIDVVSITSQRQALAFLNGEGGEVYLGPNLDLRAVFEGASLDQALGPEIYGQTGHVPSFMLAAGKLKWFQLHRPETYARITSVLTLGDWLAWKLTGEVIWERALAVEAGLLNINSRDPLVDLHQRLDIHYDPPRLADAGEIVGQSHDAAAKRTGLNPGTPVVSAGPDTQAGLVGLGVIDVPGVGMIGGWSAPVQMVTDRPIMAPGRETWAGLHSIPGRWVLESSAGDIGTAFRWLKDSFVGPGGDGYQKLDALAGSAPPGSDGAKSYLGPGRMDMSKLGMRQGGILFPVPMTVTHYGRGQLVRSSLEGFAFAIRANLEQVERMADHRASELAFGGGMARSSLFRRILTDVIGRPLWTGRDHRATARGAAAVGAIALGEFTNFDEAGESVRAQLDPIEPDPLDAAEYEGFYQEWESVGETLSAFKV